MIASVFRLSGLFLAFSAVARAEIELTVHDDRLAVTLMVDSPEIRNPIGIAVDHADRIYVIESHTSLRPSDYDGPQTDRLQLIVDKDNDGKPERIAVAAEGLRQAMSLAVSPQGRLYVVCAREIIALQDHNGDGLFDGKRNIISLQSDYQHPHYQLAGITFDEDGWLYFSRGNLGGHAYTVQGSDGTTVQGYGDGGSILRCRPGGTALQSVATGFWNVVGMDHLQNGWLIAADNDPEARGPNRLLHIVSGGDYGYQTLHGKSGQHPLLAWEGELPGTLPIVSATREAPADILSVGRTALPADGAESVLVACWGASVIERHQLQQEDLTANAASSPLVTGPDAFRPVSMAADSKGTVYITDWASNGYSNHDGGRLWRLSPKAPAEETTPVEQAIPDPAVRIWVPAEGLWTETDAQKLVKEIRSRQRAIDGPTLLNLFTHDDPFMTHVVVEALAHPVFWQQVLNAIKDTRAPIRLGALLALRKAHHPDATALVSQFLTDSDQVIRMTALRWAAELRDPQLRPALDQAITSANVSLALLETYLAAKKVLSPEILNALASRTVPSTFNLPFPSSDESLKALITSEATSDHLRALALMRIGKIDSQEMAELISTWVHQRNPALQVAAIQGLAQMDEAQETVTSILKSVALNRSYDPQVRAEAIAAWARQVPLEADWVLPLLHDHKAAVRLESARAFRLVGQLEPTLAKLQDHYLSIRDNSREAAVAEQLEFLLHGPHAEDKPFAKQRPKTVEAWQKALQSGGDVNGGRRLFHSTGLLCARCHTPGAYGNLLGPNLENLGQSVDRSRIVDSLLTPSTQRSPAYQAWHIKVNDSVTDQGVQLEWLLDGSLKYMTLEGVEVTIPSTESPSFTPLDHSIMPSGLAELMTVEEMRELVSYLESLGSELD